MERVSHAVVSIKQTIVRKITCRPPKSRIDNQAAKVDVYLHDGSYLLRSSRFRIMRFVFCDCSWLEAHSRALVNLRINPFRKQSMGVVGTGMHLLSRE